jgi:uncharacterized ion transporter superfamily protein YfcC
MRRANFAGVSILRGAQTRMVVFVIHNHFGLCYILHPAVARELGL